MSLTPEYAVDTVNKLYGRHAGSRALHAKGILLAGTFTAAPEASALTRAAHMQGDEIKATFRFSNGAGKPAVPDGAPDPRGFAIKMYLPDGARTDIVAVSNPLFPMKTPEAFIELLEAQAAGAAKAWKVPIVLARHPEALRALPTILPTLRPPRSYATIRYWGLHAFRWIDAQGGKRYVRYALVPEVTQPRYAPWQTRGLGRNYLSEEIRERVSRGPVRFTLKVQIAEPSDPIDDPSAAWPRERRRVTVGTFAVTGLETERETGGDILVFDPTRLTDGIELSGDPVLAFRPLAYGVSVARRTAG